MERLTRAPQTRPVGPKTWDLEPKEFHGSYSAPFHPRCASFRVTPFAAGASTPPALTTSCHARRAVTGNGSFYSKARCRATRWS